MGLLDRFRSAEERERRARAKSERDAERQRAAEAAAQAQAAADAEAERIRQDVAAELARQVFLEAVGPELAAAPADTPDDARLAIKLARIRKTELATEKRELAAELADVREAWRERQAGRYSTTLLGRGMTGRLIRAGVQGQRRSERLQHADQVNAFSDARQEIERKIVVVDRLLVELQRVAGSKR